VKQLQGEAHQAWRVPSTETALKQSLGGKSESAEGDSPSSWTLSISHYCSAARRFLSASNETINLDFVATPRLSQAQRLA
jgi:hypothetical protein